MEINDIEKVIKILENTDITDFELEYKGIKIKLTRKTESANIVKTSSSDTSKVIKTLFATTESSIGNTVTESSLDCVKVESPIVGTFYSKPSPDAEPFVKQGDKVKKGQTICIVEAMKLMNEIPSPCDGTVEQILMEDGQVVEYGETILTISTT
jgi:acetyl-CoA carboxylase biotin carboxyl carrier protein